MLELCALYADIHQLPASGFELRLRLRHVAKRRDTAVIAVPCERQELRIRFHGVGQECGVTIQTVELEIVRGQLRLIGKFGVLQIGSGYLCGCRAGRDAAPDASPEVRYVGRVNRQRVKTVRG